MTTVKKAQAAFDRCKNDPNDFFKRWKHTPADRAENTVGLGVAGVEATILSTQEISFRVRMRMTNDERRSKHLDYFTVDGNGSVTFGYDEAIAKGMAIRKRWRNERDGLPTLPDNEVPTVAQLIERYFEAREKGDDHLLPDGLTVNWEKDKRMMTLVYKTILHLNCRHLTRDHIHEAHMAYLTERETKTGNRPNTSVRATFNAAHPMFKWGRDKYWIPPETLMGLKAKVPDEPGRDRIVTPREWQLAAPMLTVLDANKRTRLETRNDIGLLPRWLLSTACRRSMAVNAQWGEFQTHELGTFENPNPVTLWCVPDEKMKMGITAIFPIVGEAKRLLDVLRAKCKNHGPTDYVFSPAARSAWGENDTRTQQKWNEASGTKPWTRHDLRRTTASMLQAVGADKESCKRLLAHRGRTDKSATGGYLVIGNHLEELAALSAKLLEVHQIQKDIEEGRDTAAVRKICNQMAASPEVQNFMRELGMSPAEWLRIVPNPVHVTATVHALPSVQSVHAVSP